MQISACPSSGGRLHYNIFALLDGRLVNDVSIHFTAIYTGIIASVGHSTRPPSQLVPLIQLVPPVIWSTPSQLILTQASKISTKRCPKVQDMIFAQFTWSSSINS